MAVKVPVGDAEVFALADGRHPFDLTWHYPSITSAQWSAYLPGAPTHLSFGAFLIRHAGRTALVDTGWGPYHQPPGGLDAPAGLLDELASIGVTPDDVDVVAISHLHPDHIGWNLVREDGALRPRFPRAPYLVPQADWDHYRAREEMHPCIREQALGLEGAAPLEFLADGREVVPGLRALAASGHTPGHTCFALESAGETLVLLIDLAHHPAVLHETGWVQKFDWDPDQARASRERLLDEVERNGWLAGAGHFPHPALGHVVRDAAGRRVWEPIDA